MKKSEWSDEQVELNLMQMPIIKDTRNPREIYQNISLKVNKKKRKAWIVPSIATVATALVLILLAPSFMKDNNLSMTAQDSAMERNVAMEEPNMNKDTTSESDSMDIASTENIQEEEQTYITGIPEQESYVVRNVDEDEVLLTYGVTVEYVTFPSIVSLKVKSDGGSVVEQFEENIPKLNEYITQNNLGIDEFPSRYFSNFTEINDENGNKVKIDIPGHLNTESFASAESFSFSVALDSFEYFQDDFSELTFFQNDKQGIFIGQSGVFEESLLVEKENKRAYLYYLHEGAEYKLLAQTYESFETIDEAISSMDKPLIQGDFKLHATIPKSNLIKDINQSEKNVEIIFNEDAELQNNDTYILMIDAISLTAKEFGFETITFKGNIDQIGEVPFGEPVSVPLAPNLIDVQ